ncbi:hypothetical protein K502DRAFT_235546 [Neoconidiobolus thromboides FSU 785]|nr:hypothetical protein K502DRAFT_235546 [Neoconidiobolus thromboides FSU 785]
MTSNNFEAKEFNNELSYKQLTEPVIKSSVDDREYRYIILNNDLTVLLISDPNGDKAAASLDVHVGSQNDPVELPGLAHFCEHLLFMGTEKYPKENDYSEYLKYLAENSGYSNAYTSYDHTNYYFEVGPNHLEGALDKFSQFFISSLFSASCTEREIKAVDSENKKNLQNDGWRFMQLHKSFSKKDHPFSRFSTGNLDTLLEEPKSKGIDTREELLKFYNKFYSSNIMKLVVSGKESLDKLTEWVIPRFSLVRNLNIEPPIHFDSPTPQEHFNTKVYVVPVKDTRSLSLSFEIPSQTNNYESRPATILSHFIGHEGPGSILSLLKEKSWVTSLYAGSQHNNPAFCFFEIEVELTVSGLENIENIIKIIYQYIKLLSHEGVNESHFKEIQSIHEANFKFQEKSNVSSYVSRLANRLHRPFPANEVLCSSSLLKKYDPEAVNELLNYFKPEKLMITVVSKSVKDRKDLKQEAWYGTNYAIEKLDNDFIKELNSIELNSRLYLPKSNPFIPTNFDLSTEFVSNQKNPLLLIKDENGSLWYDRSSKFKVPKASLSLFVKNPFVYTSPRHFCCLELLKLILTENLNEFSYDASIAGLSYSLSNRYNGLSIGVDGYSHKLETLLLEVIKHITQFDINEAIFDNCKEKYLRTLLNSKLNAPYNHVAYYTHYALCEKAWTDDEKYIEAPSITSNEVKEFTKEFFSRAYTDTFICGNFTAEDSIKIYKHIHELFKFNKLYSAERIPRRNVYLPKPNCSYVHQKQVSNPDTFDSAIEFYLDLYSYFDLERRSYSELIGYLISEPAFNQLRTVEQLGYIVFGGDRSLACRGGIRIIIQSERDPIYLESRIENFLENFLKIVENYTEEEFNNKVQGLIINKLKKDDNLPRYANRKWNAISTDFCDFDEAESVVSILRKVNKDKLISMIKNCVIREAPNRRKISIHMVSQKVKKDNELNFTLKDCGEVIEDLVAWIASQELSPAPKSVIPLEVYQKKD